ncbi:hypothetical protein DRN98_07490, partial [Methanosarcinales archaeon]
MLRSTQFYAKKRLSVRDRINGEESVYAADVDDDGDMDILSASYGGGALSLHLTAYILLTDHTPDQYQQNIPISSNVVINLNTNIKSTSIDSSTFNVDSDINGKIPEVYSTLNDQITFNPLSDFNAGEIVTITLTNGIQSTDNVRLWDYTWQFTIESEVGSGVFATRDIDSSSASVRQTYASDIDGDGDIDILSASFDDDKISWYENDGTGTFSEHIISTDADGATS